MPTRIRLQWDENHRIATPVSILLPGTDSAAEATVASLVDVQSAIPVPIQYDPVDSSRIWWIASPPPTGLIGEYRLAHADSPAGNPVEARVDEANLTITCHGKPVLVYHHAPVSPPPGKSPLFTRGGFIHPLYAPDGEILTAIHPPDHLHHVGIWNPWTSTEFEGRQVDFWNLGKGQGTVRFVRFESVTSGPVFGGFRAIHHHVDLKAPGGAKIALEETWDVRVWNCDLQGFLIDLNITQRCASQSPLTLNAYRYGGFAFRGRTGWHTANSDYLTSEEKTRRNGHGSRARWCHAYGTTPKGPAGILFLSHPTNREHPEPMRLWPPGANKDQNNMFFNFCPVQKKPWTLKPNRDYTLRYRLYVYAGEPSGERAETLWQTYANLPVPAPSADKPAP